MDYLRQSIDEADQKGVRPLKSKSQLRTELAFL